MARPGAQRVRAAADAAWEIRARYAESFPLPADRIDEILARSRRRSSPGSTQLEVDAVEATARALDG